MVEIGGLEDIIIGELIEGAPEAVEAAADKLETGLASLAEGGEDGLEQVIHAANELATGIMEVGEPGVEDFLERSKELLETSGVFDEIAEVAGAAWEVFTEVLEAAIEGLAEIPPEELQRIAVIVVLAVFAPEVLLENPELLVRLLAGAEVPDALG